MIFGKTDEEKLKGRLGVWFAWYPVKLVNGCWCWLQKIVYKDESIWKLLENRDGKTTKSENL